MCVCIYIYLSPEETDTDSIMNDNSELSTGWESPGLNNHKCETLPWSSKTVYYMSPAQVKLLCSWYGEEIAMIF